VVSRVELRRGRRVDQQVRQRTEREGFGDPVAAASGVREDQWDAERLLVGVPVAVHPVLAEHLPVVGVEPEHGVLGELLREATDELVGVANGVAIRFGEHVAEERVEGAGSVGVQPGVRGVDQQLRLRAVGRRGEVRHVRVDDEHPAEVRLRGVREPHLDVVDHRLPGHEHVLALPPVHHPVQRPAPLDRRTDVPRRLTGGVAVLVHEVDEVIEEVLVEEVPRRPRVRGEHRRLVASAGQSFGEGILGSEVLTDEVSYRGRGGACVRVPPGEERGHRRAGRPGVRHRSLEGDTVGCETVEVRCQVLAAEVPTVVCPQAVGGHEDDVSSVVHSPRTEGTAGFG
jgi:hypothetical protein